MDIILVNPRGFCAGVKRAIDTVDAALIEFGAPLYVKHEIVHNKHVVGNFKKRGVIFVENISDIPLSSNVILSAHGSPLSTFEECHRLRLNVIDATCPLVTKVHKIAKRFEDIGKQILIIGHRNHPEVIGTTGQISSHTIVIETEEEAKNVKISDVNNVAYITQTTLSIDDTKAIVDILHERFPSITGQYENNICYATQNRQNAIKSIISNIDLLLIVGSENSSNSNRLRDIGILHGVPSFLVDDKNDISLEWFANINTVAISAGASAPENLVQDIVGYIVDEFNAFVKEIDGIRETAIFFPPKLVQSNETI